MKIVSMKLKNFRGYQNETVINFNDITAFVGKNDIGKSTILEALDIFFNCGNGVIKLDKEDINKKAIQNGDTETVISLCFSELPTSIIIDSAVETNLEDEYMLNEDYLLEVVKKYKSGGKETVYIKALHPTNSECKDLLLKKNSDLKRIVEEKDIYCENKNNNVLLRKAIWGYYSNELNLGDVEIDVQKEGAKEIWNKLSSYLPIYSLFQADRKNSDGDSEIQDPLKEAVKQIIKDDNIQAMLTEVAQKVERKLKEVSDRTLEKLNEMDPDVAKSLNPDIPSEDKLKWADVFKNVSITGDEDIPINKRGSGVKRLVLLNFFRAEAERKADEEANKSVIYAIEEPETSQHPDNQKMLVKALKKIVDNPNTQVIITTHSPFIVKELDFDNIRVIYENETGKHILTAESSVLQYPSLNEVNYLAYGYASEEYHNELYGFIEEKEWLNEYKQGKSQRPYKQDINGKSSDKQIILTEYIRHQIHHPENHYNDHYTEEELRRSIEDMRKFIHERVEKGKLEK